MATVDAASDGKIVIAFIHVLEQQHLSNKIIPKTIIELCIKFYSLNKNLFLQFWTKYRHFGVQQYGIVNFAAEAMHMIKLTVDKSVIKSNHWISKYPPIHIANIGQRLNYLSAETLNKLGLDFDSNSYDALFGIAVTSINSHVYYPFFAFYEPSAGDQQLKVLITKRRLMPFKFVAGCKFLDCGKNGIICIKSNQMYQLKWENIVDGAFYFEKIETSHCVSDRYVYLKDRQSLFSAGMMHGKLECGLYDLKSKKYRKMPDGLGLWLGSKEWNICYDGQDKIYYVNVKLSVAVFDLVDMTWTNIEMPNNTRKVLKARKAIRFWIDSNELHCACSIKVTDANEVTDALYISGLEISGNPNDFKWTKWKKYNVPGIIAEHRWSCFV